MKKIIIILILITSITSCNENTSYKYQDREPVIDCKGLDNELVNEAYYSFREDIAIYAYNNHFTRKKNDYNKSLGYFIFNGASGTADFKSIASPHTLILLNKLKKETQLWDNNSEKSKTNYYSEFIDCLIQNIKNAKIKNVILILRETNTLSPKILNENYRVNIRDANEDKYFAMFIAFDTYYQYLYALDF